MVLSDHYSSGSQIFSQPVRFPSLMVHKSILYMPRCKLQLSKFHYIYLTRTPPPIKPLQFAPHFLPIIVPDNGSNSRSLSRVAGAIVDAAPEHRLPYSRHR